MKALGLCRVMRIQRLYQEARVVDPWETGFYEDPWGYSHAVPVSQQQLDDAGALLAAIAGPSTRPVVADECLPTYTVNGPITVGNTWYTHMTRQIAMSELMGQPLITMPEFYADLGKSGDV